MEIKLKFNPNREPVPSPLERKLIKPALLRPLEKKGSPQADANRIEEVLEEINALIGLSEVKKLIYEIRAFVEIQRKRSREKLATEPTVLHMIFKGAPGTGKTTMARLIGRLFKELGVLQKGHIVEVERADLVGEYIGHTAQKARDHLKKALGGVLFIDEAYSLARGGEKDFGKEAIDALVKGMEDHKDNLILILAGYKEEMDWFLMTNPGLRSRFPIQIEFPDYTVGELLAIAETMLEERDYHLTAEARLHLRNFIMEAEQRGRHKAGNARMVRNIIEKAIRVQAVRLLETGDCSREDLMTITAQDLEECRPLL